jgi:hypothetical protein
MENNMVAYFLQIFVENATENISSCSVGNIIQCLACVFLFSYRETDVVYNKPRYSNALDRQAARFDVGNKVYFE